VLVAGKGKGECSCFVCCLFFFGFVDGGIDAHKEREKIYGTGKKCHGNI